MKLKLIWILGLLCSGMTLQAQTLRLPHFFSDNMVLQRETKVPIWGWAKAGQKVQIAASWSKDTISTTATGDATWRMELPTPMGGGPYQITVLSENQRRELKDVLIGEVWLCSGQSNMQWSANNKMNQMIEKLPSIKNDQIRFLQISNIASKYPQDDIYDTWASCDSISARSFSAIGYFIAEKLQSELHIPIGIINSSWGGTSAEYWTPEDLVKKDSMLNRYAHMQKIAPRKPYLPGVLWNSMLHPLAGFPIAGAFWYQGEDNTISYGGYDRLIQTMVKGWRDAWSAEFPFYFVQIAPYNYKYEKPNAAFVREQQTKTALTLPHSGMVVTTDLVNNVKDIHPQLKREVAHRLADLALVYPYGKKLKDYKSPIFKEATTEGNKMRIKFHYLQGELKIKGKQLTDIVIAGEDRLFYPASAKVVGNELIVYAKEVSKPVAVRFGFTNSAMPNLFTASGLPVSPFRTDQWTQ